MGSLSAVCIVSLVVLSLFVNYSLGANLCRDLVDDPRDCDAASECITANPSGTVCQCQCTKGYVDISPDPVNKPGRKCKKGWSLKTLL
ncbi:hypothetical protein DdX_18339 [Ditylenchus destructor]|uniref:Uncharacterized protein n=1 Tax=Ditylenchus destructor TaxID=166010 RepID=A0AAD4MLS9_9BILA|nr:hypothetical protein DdX_18339 [Ditylenchus destructor]